MSRGFEVADHVADVMVRAWGSALEEVFCEMSRGMWWVIFGGAQIPALQKWTVEVTADDLEGLLVSFLNEQLASFDIGGLAVSQVERVEIEPAAPGQEWEGKPMRLRAELAGAHISQVHAQVNIQIKAATFHDLRVSPTEARVTFDV